MKKQTYLAIFISGIWILASEYFRNVFLFGDVWVKHYEQIGAVYNTSPVNGFVWFIWSMLFAYAIYFIFQKYSLYETLLFSWLTGFVLMWLVIGNLNVLPFGILPYAIPLSLLEIYVAILILQKFKN
jgi:hypothetical protein